MESSGGNNAQKILEKIYHDPSSPAGFAGAKRLLEEARHVNPAITKGDVDDFLAGDRVYGLHRPRRIHFNRAKTVPSGYLTDLQADLADFQKLSRHNNGNKYMLVGICVLSKRVFATPVRTKTPKDMCPAFDRLFKQMDMMPHRIFTDRGTEFIGAAMKQYYAEKEIEKMQSNTSSIKASLAERCIRTIKQRIYRYFSQAQTMNWVDVLDHIIDAINHSKSRSLGDNLRPVDVNFKNANKIWLKNYGYLFKNNSARRNKQPKFKKDDYVRMSRDKGIFEKGYAPNYSDEILQIDAVKRARGGVKANPVRYKVRDEKGEKFLGSFYETELARTKKDANTSYRIEKVYRSRIQDGKKQLLVKFMGYPDREWIDESQLV